MSTCAHVMVSFFPRAQEKGDHNMDACHPHSMTLYAFHCTLLTDDINHSNETLLSLGEERKLRA